MTTPLAPELDRFARDYAAHRAAEGRRLSDAELRALPYLRSGPLGRQWRVRARTYGAFRRVVLAPLTTRLGALDVVDLGAGNGWLSYRLAKEGHRCTAIDIRGDAVDGLGAAESLAAEAPFVREVASFDAIPLSDASADLVVFNAALHYSEDLARTLAEARRVARTGGVIAILDSAVYAREADGLAMVAEKRARAAQTFGERADTLIGLEVVEFLTRDRLAEASRGLGLTWRRTRVVYPLWYEWRPIAAKLRGRRAPSRFDLWSAQA